MNNTLHSVLAVSVIALVTALLRFLPFVLFRGKKETPAVITWLGQVLPYAVICMLVVFCLKDVSFTVWPHGLPELISCAVVTALHFWKHNTLLSIIAGTVCYMILIQSVFI